MRKNTIVFVLVCLLFTNCYKQTDNYFTSTNLVDDLNFTIYGNYLYSMDSGVVKVVDLASNTLVNNVNQNNTYISVNDLVVIRDTLLVGGSNAYYGLKENDFFYAYDLKNPLVPSYIPDANFVRNFPKQVSVMNKDNWLFIVQPSYDIVNPNKHSIGVYDVSNLQKITALDNYAVKLANRLSCMGNTLVASGDSVGFNVFQVNSLGKLALKSSYVANNERFLDVTTQNDVAIFSTDKGIKTYLIDTLTYTYKLLAHVY